MKQHEREIPIVEPETGRLGGRYVVMPEIKFVGSQKQIAWAESIAGKQLRKNYDLVMALFEKAGVITDSVFWIENQYDFSAEFWLARLLKHMSPEAMKERFPNEIQVARRNMEYEKEKDLKRAREQNPPDPDSVY